MNYGKIPIMIAALTLGGCAEQLKSQALKQGEENCAAMGKQFVVQDVKQKTGLLNPIWSVSVIGVCVGPEDPRYKPVF